MRCLKEITFEDGDIDSILEKTYGLKTSNLAKSGSDGESLQVIVNYSKACHQHDVIKCPSVTRFDLGGIDKMLICQVGVLDQGSTNDLFRRQRRARRHIKTVNTQAVGGT